jgi:hypothetical protein
MNWFICKVSFQKTLGNGAVKKVTEQYLVDALSFTEAEVRIKKEMESYISGDFIIADISRYPLQELFFYENGNKYYRAKLAFITLDEKTGKERRMNFNHLSQAGDIQQAKDIIVERMKETIGDYEIVEVKETPIMDVFTYSNLNL